MPDCEERLFHDIFRQRQLVTFNATHTEVDDRRPVLDVPVCPVVRISATRHKELRSIGIGIGIGCDACALNDDNRCRRDGVAMRLKEK